LIANMTASASSICPFGFIAHCYRVHPNRW
jgi:hypothetical protein